LGIKASLRERPTISFRSVRLREQLRLINSIRVCSNVSVLLTTPRMASASSPICFA
jgi:hypothetical protein